MKPQSTSGFSIIEISIVIVIIGLLSGGIIIGRELIRAAELRTIRSETEQLIAAIATFKVKYDGLPGDITNATDIWDPADTNCEEQAAGYRPANDIPTDATCNGNGDGLIRRLDGVFQMEEPFRATQQLANAGLLEGKYTGATCSTDCYPVDYRPGVNMPKFSAREVGVFFGNGYNPPPPGDASYYDGNYTLIVQLGVYSAKTDPFPCGWVCHGFMTPTEAFGMDQKYDDGRPGTGKIRSFRKRFPFEPYKDCIANDLRDEPETATYNTDSPNYSCLQINLANEL